MTDTFDANADLIGALGPGATAHFHGFTPQQVIELVQRLAAVLRAADLESITRNFEGGVRVGDTVIEPAQAEALAQLPAHLRADTPAETRHRVAAAARMVSDDLVPPADFAARAREYAYRQRARHGPLSRAEDEESVYVPLQLRFSRAIRPLRMSSFAKRSLRLTTFTPP